MIFNKRAPTEILKSISDLYLYCLVILLYLFRTVIPFFKYPFVILFIFLGIYTISNFSGRLKSKTLEFLRNYYILIGLLVYMIIALFVSNKLYISVLKDIVNAFILFFLFLFLTIRIKSKDEYSFF